MGDGGRGCEAARAPLPRMAASWEDGALGDRALPVVASGDGLKGHCRKIRDVLEVMVVRQEQSPTFKYGSGYPDVIGRNRRSGFFQTDKELCVNASGSPSHGKNRDVV